MEGIIKFSRAYGEYGCFSNFYNCTVAFNGLTFQSSEAAWQAQKTLDMSKRKEFTTLNPSESKKMGRAVKLRSDWEDVKALLMIDVLHAKFTQHPELAKVLLSTGNATLVEDTTGWHDNTWGNCDCERCANIKGKNLLGKSLMAVRLRLKKEFIV